MHKIYIYIYINTHTHTHKNSQLLRWYAMILMYSKSGILLQLHFLWSLNSNLQINRLGTAYKLSICQLLFKIKDINHHTLYKNQIYLRVKSFDTFYSSSSSPKQEVISSYNWTFQLLWVPSSFWKRENDTKSLLISQQIYLTPFHNIKFKIPTISKRKKKGTTKFIYLNKTCWLKKRHSSKRILTWKEKLLFT